MPDEGEAATPTDGVQLVEQRLVTGGALGLKRDTSARIAGAAAPAKLMATSLPATVDLRAGIPSPGDQGQQGSCVAWAVGYALKSSHEIKEENWAANMAMHQFSPAYIYNQINGDVDNGSFISHALTLLVDQGADNL